MNLDVVDVRKPCHLPWDGMKGDGRVRECGKCEKNVYDLSSMSRAEAEALLARHEGRLCIRFYRRADGTVVTADCSRATFRSRVIQAGAAMLFLAGGLFGFVRLQAATLDAAQPATKGAAQTIGNWVSASWGATPTPAYPMKGEMVIVPIATPTPAKTPVKKTPPPKKTAPAKGSGGK